MATGMNWNPIDIHTVKYSGKHTSETLETLKKTSEQNTQRMDERTMKWHEQVKDFPSPYQYLKDNIHKGL